MCISDWSSDVCSSDLDGRLYRFVSEGDLRPAVNGKMGLNMEQGKLQVLEIVGFEAGAYQEDIAVAQSVHRVKWADVLEPENRSEERRVGKECVRTCRSRGSQYH